MNATEEQPRWLGAQVVQATGSTALENVPTVLLCTALLRPGGREAEGHPAKLYTIKNMRETMSHNVDGVC